MQVIVTLVIDKLRSNYLQYPLQWFSLGERGPRGNSVLCGRVGWYLR